MLRNIFFISQSQCIITLEFVVALVFHLSSKRSASGLKEMGENISPTLNQL